MNTCPCCSNSMLRHIRHHQVCWFCDHCWQEMPLIEQSPGVNVLSPSLENRFASLAGGRSHATV